MKLSLGLFWSLFLATVITQYGSSFVTTKRIQVDQNEEELLSDSGNQVGIQNGNDVIIAQPGTLDVSVTQHEALIFGVPEQQCNGEFFACYEADPPGQYINSFISDSCDTKCGFYVAGRDNKITYMTLFETENTGRTKGEAYSEVAMTNGSTFLNGRQLKTCSPKVENGIVHLQIQNASSECSVVIKYATIKTEPTTQPPTTSLGSTSGPNTVSGGQADATTEASSSIGDYWWAFLIVGIVIVAIGIAILVYCLIKRRNRSKKPAAPRRKLRGSQSPIVLRPSAEAQPSHEAAAPPSYLSQSSIFSHKSMLLSKKEEAPKEKVAEAQEPEETDLTSVKPTA